MVHDIPNYWLFGICQLSGILTTREHNVSEVESASFLSCGEGVTSSVGCLCTLHHRFYYSLASSVYIAVVNVTRVVR
jgi:hypothetical protein